MQEEKQTLSDDTKIVSTSKDQMKSTAQTKPKIETLQNKINTESILMFYIIFE